MILYAFIKLSAGAGLIKTIKILKDKYMFIDKNLFTDNFHKRLYLGKIDYINASPVYYGLDNGLKPDWLEMIEGPPAVLNKMIKQGKIEISPVSAAFYGMNHRDFLVLPDFSISCNGRVLSVILMSNFPIDNLDGKNIVLTEDSATAAALVRLMLNGRGISANFSKKRIRNISDIPERTDAALVIGDAALTMPWENYFSYRMDLGEIWFKEKNLPFVFALWVVRRSYAMEHGECVQEVLDLFHASRKKGYEHLDEIIRSGADKLGLDELKIREYYDLLFCDLDKEKKQALQLFFDSLYDINFFREKVELRFF